MTTNSLGNLYVRWNAAPQLLPENAGEEWMKEAERQGICCMTIYAGTPPEMRERIKEAWGARYLGNNIGERTGFLYGSRFEMKGPQDRNLTEAREWFMSQFLRGDRPPRTGGTGEDPRMFATSGAAFANYELPAGVDFVCNELYAVGCANLTYATSEARGAARKWGPEWWAGWLAHEWQTFGIPYQSDDKYLSFEAGIKALYVMGTSLMCLESGSTGTQAHPYTKDADRNGYKYGDEPPRRYRETLRKCHAFITAHPRAKGTPETKIALALGQNDGYMGQSRDDVAPWGTGGVLPQFRHGRSFGNALRPGRRRGSRRPDEACRPFALFAARLRRMEHDDETSGLADREVGRGGRHVRPVRTAVHDARRPRLSRLRREGPSAAVRPRGGRVCDG